MGASRCPDCWTFTNLRYCETFAVHCSPSFTQTQSWACSKNRKSFLPPTHTSKRKKKKKKLLVFVWKGNEAEQNGRLNSEREKRERRGESCGSRGKQCDKEEAGGVMSGPERELGVRPPSRCSTGGAVGGEGWGAVGVSYRPHRLGPTRTYLK